MPKTIQFIGLFNGTTNKKTDKYPTNVVHLFDGLQQNATQKAFYQNGVGNSDDWGSVTRWIASATGIGAGWHMDEMEKAMIKSIKQSIDAGEIKGGDTIELSVNGFSRGATQALDFQNTRPQKIAEAVNQYLAEKQGKKQSTWDWLVGNKPTPEKPINVKVKAVYLFDAVGAYGIPGNLEALEVMGIENQKINIGWNFKVKPSILVRHAVSLDEVREGFEPTLVEHHNRDETVREVWFSGDHSTVGGSHEPPADKPRMAEEHSLRWMAQWMQKDGLGFKETFGKKHLGHENRILGHIDTPNWIMLPSTQRENREVFVTENGEKSKTLPVAIHDTVMRRLQTDKSYRPDWIQKMDKLKVVFDNSNEHVLSAEELTQLKNFLAGNQPIHITRSKKAFDHTALFAKLDDLRAVDDNDLSSTTSTEIMDKREDDLSSSNASSSANDDASSSASSNASSSGLSRESSSAYDSSDGLGSDADVEHDPFAQRKVLSFQLATEAAAKAPEMSEKKAAEQERKAQEAAEAKERERKIQALM